VRSWIFRNRLRLRALYGPQPPTREPSERPARRIPVRVPAVVERHGKHTVLRTRGKYGARAAP